MSTIDIIKEVTNIDLNDSITEKERDTIEYIINQLKDEC